MLIFPLLLLAGCSKMNEAVTLWRGDKIPYGTYYAFQNLRYIFPDAEVEISKASPARVSTFNLPADRQKSVESPQEDSAAEDYEKPAEENVVDEEERIYNPPSVFIALCESVNPDESEVNALLNFAGSGNQVFISSLEIGHTLLDSFRLSTSASFGVYNVDDSLTLNVLHPVSFQSSSFTYPGKALENYFVKMDSSITTILGKNEEGSANFIKFSYEGGGAIYLHLAPAAFTNFFLLHKQNKSYYDLALSSLPGNVKKIIWDDYYRTHSNGNDQSENSAFSKLQAFLKHPALRWAFWLAILMFAMIYLFESKRKQRVVPVINPLKNASLDFVKTIGRLYYQRRDNKNLASKMASQFMEQVRMRYNLPTAQLDEEFAIRLAHKSGYDLNAVKDIVYQVRTLEDHPSVDDDSLMLFHEKLNKFNKHS